MVVCWSGPWTLWKRPQTLQTHSSPHILRPCSSPSPPRARQGTEQGSGSVLGSPWPSPGAWAADHHQWPALSTPHALLWVMSFQVGCLLYISFAITGLINTFIHCGWLQMEAANRLIKIISPLCDLQACLPSAFQSSIDVLNLALPFVDGAFLRKTAL